jgi:hypothetical protein
LTPWYPDFQRHPQRSWIQNPSLPIPSKTGHRLSEARKARKMPDKKKSSYVGMIQEIQREIRNFVATASGGYVKWPTFF